jgi:Polyketide cyclase / dehydrase and lipid transport
MRRFAMLLGALLLPAPALAEVHETSPSGFVIRLSADVPATPQRAWATLIAPSRWWDADHTYSKQATNLSIDPRAGGCFCEVLPNPVSPKAAPRGSVEHMRVVYVEEPRALRMSGALGPFQAGAATGTLTIYLRPQGEGTRILWEYVYGGFVRGEVAQHASAVDSMLAGQLRGLAQALGAKSGAGSGAALAPTAPAPAPALPAEAERIDFVREMQAGIEQSANPDLAPFPDAPEAGPPAPVKPLNEQGFSGR